VTKVEAIVQVARLEPILQRLELIGIDDLVVSEVRGFGRQHGHGLLFRGSPYSVEFVPKVRIEWYGDDREADAVWRAIAHSARTGNIGDGRIFLSEVAFGADLEDAL